MVRIRDLQRGHLYNGNTLALQARNRGSIPLGSTILNVMKKSTAAIKLMKYVMKRWGGNISNCPNAPVEIVAKQLKEMERHGIKFDKE